MIDGKLLYPIGSIYMNIQDTNPSVFFGGTWERIAKGRTLVGVDENDPMFNESLLTGGEKTHELSVEEMPKHAHTTQPYAATAGGGSVNDTYVSGGTGTPQYYGLSGETGDGKAHNNMPPFLTCYIFVRTA